MRTSQIMCRVSLRIIFLCVAVFCVATSSPFAAQAAGITPAQKESVQFLLESYRADADTLRRVDIALSGAAAVLYFDPRTIALTNTQKSSIRMLLEAFHADPRIIQRVDAVLGGTLATVPPSIPVFSPSSPSTDAGEEDGTSSRGGTDEEEEEDSEDSETASGGASEGSAPPPSEDSEDDPQAATKRLALKVDGSQLVDAHGKTVQLRGVNFSGFEFVPIQGWSPSDPSGGQGGQPHGPKWSAIKDWKANVIRIPLNEASWLGYSCTDTSGVVRDADPGNNYQSAIKTQVAQANKAGLYVILDLHWAAPGNTCPMLQTQMANADHSIDFWKSVARTFKDNPSVLFELYNEPFMNFDFSGDAWTYMMKGTGGSFSGYPATSGSGEWKDIKAPWEIASYQDMINAVRGTGATNVVVVGTMQYAQDFDRWLETRPTDPLGQMAAAWHPYPTYGTTRGTPEYAEPNFAPEVYKDVEKILAAGIPVIATETGDRNTDGTPDAPLVSRVTSWADEHGVGVIGWGWNVWGEPDHVLIKDADGKPTDGYGKVFRDWLRGKTDTTPPDETNPPPGDDEGTDTSTSTSPASGYPEPYMESFSPLSGFIGTTISIIGKGFTGLTSAWIGSARNAGLKVVSDTKVEVTVPAQAQTGKIGLLNPENAAFSPEPFTVKEQAESPPTSDREYPEPYIQSFSPTSGQPGTVITVLGKGFTGLTSAWIGNSRNAKVEVVSDTEVRVTVPVPAKTGKVGLLNSKNAAFSPEPFTVIQ